MFPKFTLGRDKCKILIIINPPKHYYKRPNKFKIGSTNFDEIGEIVKINAADQYYKSQCYKKQTN